jgi:SAM-dependent methyltransferase
MQTPPDALDEWLATPLGRTLLAREQAAVTHSLEHVFGTQLLQVGHWGPPDTFLPHARTQLRALVAEPGAAGDFVSHASSLAVLSGSVDAVLLPHTLEFEPEPHEVLREVDRVLVGEGHLIVLGFEPWSWWAVRHHLSERGFPPGLTHLLSRGRLRDWLRLLGFDVLEVRRFLHALPLSRLHGGAVERHLERAGHWCGGKFGSVYLLKAKKRVYTLTPVRPKRRRSRPALVGALVEPTTRVPGPVRRDARDEGGRN